MLRLILTLGAVVAVVLADEEEKVPYCEELKGMPNLDLTRLKGVWWEWASSGTISFLMPHNCHVSNFYPSADGKSVDTFNDYITTKKVKKEYKQEHVQYSWKITDETPAGNGPREYVVQIENFMGDVKVIPMTVIHTDYDRYLIISLCKDASHFLKKFKSALLLTRNKSWSDDELTDINSKVEAALATVGKTTEDLGLVHSPFLVKNCEMPKFPNTPPPFPSINTSPDASTPGVAIQQPSNIAQQPGLNAQRLGSPTTSNGYGAQKPSNIAQQPFAAQRLGSAPTPNGYGAQQLSNAAQQQPFAAQRLGTATNGYGAQQPSTTAQQPGLAGQRLGSPPTQNGYGAQQPGLAAQRLGTATNGYGAQQPGLAAQRLGTATNGYGAQQPSNTAQRPGAATSPIGNAAQKPSVAPQQPTYAARPGSATPSFAVPPSGYSTKPASATAAFDDFDYDSEDEDTDTSVPINNYSTQNQNAARPYSGAYSAWKP